MNHWRDPVMTDEELEELYMLAEMQTPMITQADHEVSQFWRNLVWGVVLLAAVSLVSLLYWMRV